MLQAAWLPQLASGEAKGTVALAEGNAPLPPKPSTAYAGGKLFGAKEGVTAGLVADFAVVWACCDGHSVLVLAELGAVARGPVDSFDNSRLVADPSAKPYPLKFTRGRETAEIGVFLRLCAQGFAPVRWQSDLRLGSELGLEVYLRDQRCILPR